MNATLLETKFNRIGARLKLLDRPAGTLRNPAAVSLNVRSDGRGEFFEIARPPAAELAVLDVRPADRHLLLLVREDGEKGKFLCGHDERHWFVAGIPEAAPVGTIPQAKAALKPVEVRAAEAAMRVRSGDRDRRKNAAFVRQGEWFFLPAPDFVADERQILRWEPLRRGWTGKPHWTEFLVRSGGETVYVCSQRPNGITAAEYKNLLAARPKAKAWNWRVMSRNPGVYVRGRVRHTDHATISLPGWHRVVMNTENQAKAMRNVAFLD